MTRSTREQRVRQFIAAYNSFDVEGMVALLAPEIRFENYSGAALTAAATGIDEFRQLAERSKVLFSDREQRITSLELRDRSVVVGIHYRGRLATDVPDGPAAGTVLDLDATSEYFFDGERISRLIDRS